MVPTEGAASDVAKDTDVYSSYRGGEEMESYEQYYNSPQNHSGWGHVDRSQKNQSNHTLFKTVI